MIHDIIVTPHSFLGAAIAHVLKGGGNYLPTVTVRWHHTFSVTSHVAEHPMAWLRRKTNHVYSRQAE